jgi:hypothetical protein
MRLCESAFVSKVMNGKSKRTSFNSRYCKDHETNKLFMVLEEYSYIDRYFMKKHLLGQCIHYTVNNKLVINDKLSS